MQSAKTLTKIIKRNGNTEPFDPYKITRAIFKAGEATGEFEEEMARKLTIRVLNLVHQLMKDHPPRSKKFKISLKTY